jgi:hypothetical protein
MTFTDLLPDRPLTREEFQALERNENIDSLETDDSESGRRVLRRRWRRRGGELPLRIGGWGGTRTPTDITTTEWGRMGT